MARCTLVLPGMVSFTLLLSFLLVAAGRGNSIRSCGHIPFTACNAKKPGYIQPGFFI